VDFVTGGIAPDPKNSIKVPHPPIPRTHSNRCINAELGDS
jgi:hypothetical protein